MEIRTLASGSSGNCYYIDDGITPLLLECGIPFREIQRKLNFTTSKLGGVLITHEHQDHCKAINDVMKAGIDCYLSPGTMKALGVIGHRIKTVSARVQFNLGSWTILPFETEHDAAEPLGFLLASSTGKKLLYATDTYYIRYTFNGLTHIMVECNHSYEILKANVESGVLPAEMKKRLIKSHFSLENVKDFFKANDLSKVQEIWLIHLSNGNNNAEQFKREIQALTGKMVIIA